MGLGSGAPEQPEGGSWTEDIYYGHYPGEWGGLFYTTRGESQIIRAHVEGHWNDSGSHVQNYVVLYTPTEPHTEDYGPLPEATEGSGGYACAPVLSCPGTTAGSAPPENNNTAAYEQEAYGSGEGHGGENTVTRAYVEISQEKGPELEFNKTNSTVYNESTKRIHSKCPIREWRLARSTLGCIRSSCEGPGPRTESLSCVDPRVVRL
jgi:hypothetical protein